MNWTAADVCAKALNQALKITSRSSLVRPCESLGVREHEKDIRVLDDPAGTSSRRVVGVDRPPRKPLSGRISEQDIQEALVTAPQSDVQEAGQAIAATRVRRKRRRLVRETHPRRQRLPSTESGGSQKWPIRQLVSVEEELVEKH